MTLPPALTFEDGQRKLYGLLMAAAGVCYGIAGLSAGALIMWGNWPPELAHLRLCLIGAMGGGAILGSMAVTIALAVGGPVGRFKVSATKDGASIEAESDDSASRPQVAQAPVVVTKTAAPIVLSPKVPDE